MGFDVHMDEEPRQRGLCDGLADVGEGVREEGDADLVVDYMVERARPRGLRCGGLAHKCEGVRQGGADLVVDYMGERARRRWLRDRVAHKCEGVRQGGADLVVDYLGERARQRGQCCEGMRIEKSGADLEGDTNQGGAHLAPLEAAILDGGHGVDSNSKNIKSLYKTLCIVYQNVWVCVGGGDRLKRAWR